MEKRISDGRVLKLIRQWLHAPVLEAPKGPHEPPRKVYPKQGTPQGAVISPLLANLYLHWMEKRFYAANGPSHFADAQIIRYADDFVILARYQGHQICDWVEAIVEDWMGLTINRDKTKIVWLQETGSHLDFLGYSFLYAPDQFGRDHRFLCMVPSAKACARERDVIRNMISHKQSYVPIHRLIEQVNRQLIGWSGYFNKGRSRPAFGAMNWYVQSRLIQHLKRRSQRPYRPPEGVSWYSHLHHDLGLVKL